MKKAEVTDEKYKNIPFSSTAQFCADTQVFNNSKMFDMSNIVVSCTPFGETRDVSFPLRAVGIRYLSFSATVKQGSDIAPL